MTPIKVSLPPTSPALSDEEARELVAAKKWYHKYELRSGLRTPGDMPFESKSAADSLGIPADLAGKRALDIGAWDGPMTFELERRGAQAYALDIQDPTRVGFDVARRVLGSKAIHYQGSVYQLPCEELRELDLIVCRGVYYHLKYPLLAFERMSAALKMGGMLYFEGEGLINYAENLTDQPVKLDIDAILETQAPVCLFYPGRFKNSSNWFVPSPAGLVSMLYAAGFELKELKTWTTRNPPRGDQRLYGWAEKVRENSELEEHGLC